MGFARWLSGKDPPASEGDAGGAGLTPWVRKIAWRRKWQIHSGILAWRIPWTEEPDGLQPMGSGRVGHD